VKITKGEGVGAQSLDRSTLGVWGLFEFMDGD